MCEMTKNVSSGTLNLIIPIPHMCDSKFVCALSLAAQN